MERRRHIVVIPGEADAPLKVWLRQHPSSVPSGLDPTVSTSQQLRNALRRRGWKIEASETEVRLVPPTDADKTLLIEEVDDDGPDSEAQDGPLFALEAELRNFLAKNLPTIPVAGKRLRLYGSETEPEGIEYVTPVGRIDILAVDDDGAFYVFELKQIGNSDKVVGQIARYMGWVHNSIGRGRPVFGVIVAQSVSARLRYAASIVPNIHMFEYKVDFRLNAANEIIEA